MASHELYERGARSQLPSDWEDKSLHNMHNGERAAKVKVEQTKVRVSILSRHKKSHMLIVSTQRIFNFAQIFFFALTYMSSWETMAL
jgi:hypothetical protein